jgi:hypothetical protein
VGSRGSTSPDLRNAETSRAPIFQWLRKADMQAVRSKPARPALVGRRSNRLRRLAAMRERQPRGQLVGRLLWGLAVEGHHRSGDARRPAKLGAPPVADGHHLYVVRTPADRFFEMVNGQLSGGSTLKSGATVILRSRHVRSSEADHEGASTITHFDGSPADPVEEKSALSGCPQHFHASSTGFPQDRV